MSPKERGELAPEAITRIVLRPVASPLPLGFLAFGTGTILLTALELQWVPLAQGSALMVMVLAFVAPLELLAGVFAFLARDSGAATALSTLGATWVATALTVLRTPAGATSTSLGIFLLTLATMMLVLSAGALRSKPLFGVLLLAGSCRFVLTGLYQAAVGGTTLEKVSGWLGVPLVAFCLYGALALLLEDGAQRTILPLGRRGRARTSIEGDLGHQIEQAESEPGIRRQL
ncbi:MAG TPA: GPR1/FUN34/YaaH family transporter [Streptosporangiaceae bacterium]|nr:GPR1/FUN34/YaaH family transporter [Streptosporangiaceae bacterium]